MFPYLLFVRWVVEEGEEGYHFPPSVGRRKGCSPSRSLQRTGVVMCVKESSPVIKKLGERR